MILLIKNGVWIWINLNMLIFIPMELVPEIRDALISALKKLKEKCDITVYTDSKYISDAFNSGWIWNWVKKGWKKSDKSPVLNVELWMELLDLLSKNEYKIIWVKGHAGHPENERCDKLATAEAAKYSENQQNAV